MDRKKVIDTFMDLAKDIAKDINEIPKYIIEIGVFSEETGRKEKVEVGITNAELMFIHENGSPIRQIPSRPVLQMTIDYANKELLEKSMMKAVSQYLNNNKSVEAYEKELQKMCLRMERYARHIIYDNDGRLAPNSPSVAKAKGGNHPLFNTGQLARSITCRPVKI